MAIVWGAWSKRIRFGWDVAQTPSSVGSGTGTVSLKFSLYWQQDYTSGGYDQTNTVTISGAISTSFSHNFDAADKAVRLVKSWTITVPTSYAGTVSRSVTATNGSPFFDGADPSASRTWTVAKRPPQVPSPPSSASVARTSPTSVTVSWVRPSNYASDATKWANALVRRQDNAATGAWPVRATLSASATSWLQTGLALNSRYRFGVAGQNATGTSDIASTGYVYTTPATPTAVSASKAGSDVRVAFSSSATWASSFEVEDDGAGVVASGPSSPVTVTAPNPAVTHRYRVRAVAPDGTKGGWSAWSNTLQLQAPPLAPRGLDPNGYSIPSGDLVTFVWEHSPVDGTAQTGFELRYRLVGQTSWTVLTGTSNQWLDVWDLPDGSYEWQARTKAADPSFGPWSALAVFVVAIPPSATLTAPGPVVAGSSTPIEWGYTQPDGHPQSAWEAQVVSGETVVAGSGVQTGSGSSWTSPPVLENGASLTARVRVRSSAGVWSAWATQAFTVAYAPPAVPLLDVEWVPETGNVSARAAAQSGGGEVARNLVSNPNGELNADRWAYGFVATTIARDTAQKYSGTASIKGTSLTDNRLEVMAVIPGLKVGDTYTVSAQVRGSKPMSLNFGQYSFTESPPTLAVTTSWTRLSTSFTAGQSTVKVGICNGDNGAAKPLVGDSVWIDEMIVTKGDQVVAYFDGSTPDANGLDYQWTGTAHASQSVAVDPTQATIQPTVALMLEKSVNGAEWELVGQSVEDIDVMDYEVPLSGSVRYRAVAMSALPSTAEQVVNLVSPHDADDHTSCGVWLNGGPGYMNGVLFPSNVDITETVGLDRSLAVYDGRPLPVPNDSIHVLRSFAVSVDVLDDPRHPSPLLATHDRLRELALTKGVHLYRHPDGAMVYCQIDVPRMGHTSKGQPSPMQFTVTEVDRPTQAQIDAQAGFHPAQMVEVRPGEFILAGGPAITETLPGEYTEVSP